MATKKLPRKDTVIEKLHLVERALNAGFIVIATKIGGDPTFRFIYNDEADHGTAYAEDDADPRFVDGDLREPFHLTFHATESTWIEAGIKILEVEQFHKQCADNLASAQAGWDSLTPDQRRWLEVGDRPS
jgi:hypothetical protein